MWRLYVILLLSMFTTFPIYAEDRAGVTISEQQVKQFALTNLERMVKVGALQSYWSSARVKSVSQEEIGGRELWKIQFLNSTSKGSRLPLIMYLQASGRYDSTINPDKIPERKDKDQKSSATVARRRNTGGFVFGIGYHNEQQLLGSLGYQPITDHKYSKIGIGLGIRTTVGFRGDVALEIAGDLRLESLTMGAGLGARRRPGEETRALLSIEVGMDYFNLYLDHDTSSLGYGIIARMFTK